MAKKKIKKNFKIALVASTLSLLAAISYFTYSFVKIDNIATNINTLSIPLLILLIAFIIFIFSLKSKENNSVYIALSIVLILFISFSILTDKKIIKLPEEEKFANYVNKDYSSLKEWCDKNNIELETNYEYSDEIEKGKIIRLDINEGTLVKDIKVITVTISDGPDYDKTIILPSMLGWNVDDVLEYVNKNFLINVTINFENDSTEKDIIFKQNKNGELRRNSEIIFTCSLGDIKDIPTIVSMENLLNKDLLEAIVWLKRNNVNYKVEYEFSDKDKNTIIKQNIEEGKEIDTTKDEVILTISKGKAIKMIDLTKLTVNEVTDWIIKNNLKIAFDEIYDESIETGKIIKQSIAVNTEIATETLITVTISKGQIKMQKFNSLYEFKEWANKYNVKYSESYEYSSTVQKGSVISYSYNENDIVDPDSVIYVKVSLGKAITIPSFVGISKTEAQNTCNSLGLKCNFVSGNYTNYNQNVIYAQSRAKGNRVASGSAITLTLSRGIPQTYKLSIMQNDLSVGNADATINNLKKVLASRYPGVNFVFQKVKDNTLNSGLPSPSSPTKNGVSIKQGQTYTIYIVAN